MFMGGNNTSLFGGGGRKSIFRGAGEAVRDTAVSVGSSVRHATAETASQVAGTVRQGPATVAEQGSQTVGQVADAVASAYDATTNAASRATETISNATARATHAMQDAGTKWGRTVQQNIPELFERQPLLLGAIGIAIGAGIAASIPTTEAEGNVMGRASDLVRETVSEKSAQVRKMADAAVHEAKLQGLTPETASEALRTIGDDG